jgi:glutathione S-transferase
MVTLFYSPGSPYARIVRVALIEIGLAPRIDHVEVTLRDPASALLPYNPVGRVPTLRLDDGAVLTETLLILHWLDTQLPAQNLWPRDNIERARMGTAMGLLDGIAVWNRELRRPENERSPGVLALEETRANRTARELESLVASGAYAGPIDAGRIALGCVLGYCERRHPAWAWRPGRPELAAWHDRIMQRPSFQQTMPPL